jgi:protein involved in polysaccharide export with SLBB domain
MCNRGVDRLRDSKARCNAPAYVSILFLLTTCSANAQTGIPVPPATPDLVRKNMAHVAASVSQVEPILRSNPGLLLELKNWVAREAANQGRVLTDADLTDLVIFDRLRSDTEFRAVATRLLQRYGYLAAELNPDSQAGKQQDYINRERAKLQVAKEAQPAQLSLPARNVRIEKPAACDPDEDASCESSDQAGSGAQEVDEPPFIPQIVPPPIPVTPEISSKGGLEKASMLMSSPTDSLSPQATSHLMESFGASGGQQGLGLLGLDQLSGLVPGISTSDIAAEAAFNSAAAGGSAAENSPVVTGGREAGGSTGTTRSSRREVPSGMVHVKSPYDSVPVIYDMYAQAPDLRTEPKVFGTDVFNRGTKASLKVPMDMPAGPDYVVGPGDSLTINLWGGVTQRIVRPVDREGRVALPAIGPVLIAGKTLDQAQRAVQTALRSEFRDISADLSLSRLRTVRVYVAGDVVRPGPYDISALTTALGALFVAGGPTSNGSLRVVRHYRGDRLLEEVDVYDLILRGVRAAASPLENGDTIVVPPVGPQVTVKGAVRRPAIYETHGETTLAEILDLAGGMLPTAALRHIEVQRLIAHESRTMLSLNVSNNDDQKTVGQQLAAFRVQPGDIVQIFPIAPVNKDAVYLQGHVIRPGRYSYHPEMRLADLVASYDDLLPEPASAYAEIIRLVPPTYAPVVFSFNLADALAKPVGSPLLQPLDTVRIFGRYDFEDAPSVTVTGAVRRPGTYRTTGQVHVTDAIHIGGDLTRDASPEDAQLVHHLPDGTVQVLNINLRSAESGDPSHNVLLNPGDRLLVHEDQRKSNPATVLVQGEVANPGRYPLTAALHVSDLVRVAGGLKRSADTTAADLVHYLPSNHQVESRRDIIRIDTALSGKSEEDKALEDGDVLTVRRLGGWDDMGATVALVGELQHPGTYGFRPGERLSSVLKRAGGFSANAYPFGAVLVRSEVQELQQQSRAELVRRLQAEQQQLKLLPDVDVEMKKAKEAAIQQLNTTVSNLVNSAAVGRVVIHISSKIDRWENTPNDIQLRAGDRLYVPKKMELVSVTGQVFNPTTVTYRPGKNAKWYLDQAGGPSGLANKKGVFVVRADGSVIGGQGNSFWRGKTLSASLLPGDTVVVPEKAFAGGKNFQNALQLAQLASAIASTVYLATLGL